MRPRQRYKIELEKEGSDKSKDKSKNEAKRYHAFKLNTMVHYGSLRSLLVMSLVALVHALVPRGGNTLPTPRPDYRPSVYFETRPLRFIHIFPRADAQTKQ